MYIHFNRPNSLGFVFVGGAAIFDGNGEKVEVDAAALDLETGLIEQVRCVGGVVQMRESREEADTVAIFRTPPLTLVDATGRIVTAGGAPPDSVMGFTRPRSGRWRGERDRHLAAFPTCAACGSRGPLNVHHLKPFHLFPELELEPSNLLTLCESVGQSCHLLFGHLKSWKSWNPHAKVHANLILQAIQERPGREKPFVG